MISSAPIAPADARPSPGWTPRRPGSRRRPARTGWRTTPSPPDGAPDQHDVALLHAGAVARDQLPVRGGVHQPGDGGLLPGQVVGLGHQLVGLDQGELGQAAEVGLEAPDPLLGVEHRVVVAVGALQLDRQAVRDHLVAGLPRVSRPGPVRSTTPDRSEPTTWYGRSWRLVSGDELRPYRCRKAKVDTGSKIEVQTVL